MGLSRSSTLGSCRTGWSNWHSLWYLCNLRIGIRSAWDGFPLWSPKLFKPSGVDTMFLYVFVILLMLALALTIFGEWLDFSLTLIGFTMLFIMGAVLLSGQIEYKIGVNSTQVYYYDNVTDGGEDWDWDLQLSNVSVSSYDVYDSYSGAFGHTIGFLLAIAGIFGFIVTLLKIREDKKEREAEAQVEIS